MLNNYDVLKVARCLLILLIITLTGVGCTDNKPQPQPQPQSSDDPTGKSTETQNGVGADRMVLTLYFATKDGSALVAEKREVPKNSHPTQTALAELIAGPRNKELVKVMPATTKVRNISMVNHVAYVDFNDAFAKDHWGGSAGEILTISAVINTMTEFPEIKQVQFMTEGKKLETLKGHLDLSEPLSRNEAIIKK
jgi:spore germination protein GerM